MCRAGGWVGLCVILIFGHCVIIITFFFGSAKVFEEEHPGMQSKKQCARLLLVLKSREFTIHFYATIVWVFLIAQLAHKKYQSHTQRELWKGREQHNSSSSRTLHIIRFSALPCNDGDTKTTTNFTTCAFYELRRMAWQKPSTAT